MAYYDSFITQFNGAAGATTQAKIDTVNALTAPATGTVIVPSYAIYSAIVPADFTALTAANQQLVRDIFGQGQVNVTQGSNAFNVLANVFSGKATTLANLSALVKVPWWQANGYFRAFHLGDAVICGLDASTGYSATIGAATTSGQNITVAVTISGPNGSLSIPAGPGNTVTADYAKYHAANQIFAMMGRDAALATF